MANTVVTRWNEMLEKRWAADELFDIHQKNAGEWFGSKPGDADFRRKRNIAKFVALGTVSDLSPEGVRISIEKHTGVNLSLTEVGLLMTLFKRDYPDLWN